MTLQIPNRWTGAVKLVLTRLGQLYVFLPNPLAHTHIKKQVFRDYTHTPGTPRKVETALPKSLENAELVGPLPQVRGDLWPQKFGGRERLTTTQVYLLATLIGRRRGGGPD